MNNHIKTKWMVLLVHVMLMHLDHSCTDFCSSCVMLLLLLNKLWTFDCWKLKYVRIPSQYLFWGKMSHIHSLAGSPFTFQFESNDALTVNLVIHYTATLLRNVIVIINAIINSKFQRAHWISWITSAEQNLSNLWNISFLYIEK